MTAWKQRACLALTLLGLAATAGAQRGADGTSQTTDAQRQSDKQSAEAKQRAEAAERAAAEARAKKAREEEAKRRAERTKKARDDAEKKRIEEARKADQAKRAERAKEARKDDAEKTDERTKQAREEQQKNAATKKAAAERLETEVNKHRKLLKRLDNQAAKMRAENNVAGLRQVATTREREAKAFQERLLRLKGVLGQKDYDRVMKVLREKED